MRPKRVLYAEDEYTNRKLIQIRLEREGIECVLAEDGNEALELYRKGRFDMVILDYYMPTMNGDQVTLAIRKEDPDIPILVITSDDGEINYLQSCGANEIIVKPLQGTGPIRKILNYLREEE
jgi:CheY-like chemotaxis protein